MDRLIQFLHDNNIQFFENLDIANFSSIRIKALVRAFALPESEDKLIRLIDFLVLNNIKFRLIGKMTNLLPIKTFYDEVVVTTRKIKDIDFKDDILRVGCGASMPAVARIAKELSLSGFEELSGIPGSIGGMLRMNAGAYGKTISDSLKSVYLYDVYNRKTLVKSKGDMCFSYRKSILDDKKGLIVLSADFLLKRDEKEAIKQRMVYFKEKRKASQPINAFSLGSVFLRDEAHPAPAYLIDKAGLKGMSVGGIQVSEVHSGFFINNGNGTAQDFLKLKRLVKKRVFSLYGVELKEEFEEL